jgi:transposase
VTGRRQPRRRFSKEFKREAVKLFRESGKNISRIASELGVRPNVLRGWVDMVEAEEKTGIGVDSLEELARLRKENARLKMEVEILGEATAFFANRRK